MCPALVPTSGLQLPSRFRPISLAGRSQGVLGYVRYQPPSPLVYDELFWMPTQLRDRGGARGYHVAVMYVDLQATLRGGRELWWLPKTMARFERTAGGVTVDAEDGTHMELDLEDFGPSFELPMSVATLQARGEEAQRFRGSGTGRARAARMRVRSLRGAHHGWAGLSSARMSPLAVHVTRFSTEMKAPQFLDTR